MAILAQWTPNVRPNLQCSFAAASSAKTAGRLHNQTPAVPVAKTQTRHKPNDFQCPSPFNRSSSQSPQLKIQMIKNMMCRHIAYSFAITV